MVFPDEGQLIQDLKIGDQAAVASWYRHAKPRLMAFFVKQIGNESDAQELVHDTYLSCLSALPLFRGESGLWSFMLSIARHELADFWRKRYAKKAIALLPFGQEFLESIGSRDPGQSTPDIEELLRTLPHEISELLQLKYIDGLSVKELARHYGLSFSAMQSKLYRAKEVFKQEYEQSSRQVGPVDQ
jgi:RNA polymerase sigma-70 factor, ECF subfamily